MQEKIKNLLHFFTNRYDDVVFTSQTLMIPQLIKHELITKQRSFVLNEGEEILANAESTDQGIVISASKKVEEQVLSVSGYTVYCDGLIVKTLSKKCTVPVGDILSLRYTIHVTGI